MTTPSQEVYAAACERAGRERLLDPAWIGDADRLLDLAKALREGQSGYFVGERLVFWTANSRMNPTVLVIELPPTDTGAE